MALELPKSRLSLREIQPIQRKVPLDQILAVQGQNPVAQGIDTLGQDIGQVLQKRATLQQQGQQIAQLAALSKGQDITGNNSLTPDLYEKGLALHDTAQSKQAAAAKDRVDLELKLEKLRSGYSEIDPTSGKVTKYPGVQGASIKYDAQGNPTFYREPQPTPTAPVPYEPASIPKPIPVPGGGGKGDPLKELQNDIDPAQPKAGMTKLFDRNNSAARVLTLLDQSNGNPNALQSSEAASAVASLVSGNQGRVAQQQLDHLTPQSLKGDINKQLGYLLNYAKPLDQQDFFKSLRDTAVRERDVTQSQIKQTQIQRLARHEGTRQLNPQGYNATLLNFGLDPSKVQGGRYIDNTPQPGLQPLPNPGVQVPLSSAAQRLLDKHK